METGGFSFFHRLRVRYSEIDGKKVVFNAHYLTYLHLAITEYFRNLLGDKWLEDYEGRFEIVLRKTVLEFNRPAVLDDFLSVGCRIVHMGNSSFTCRFQLAREGAEDISLMDAEITYVNVGGSTGKPQAIPEDVREKIARFEDECA